MQSDASDGFRDTLEQFHRARERFGVLPTQFLFTVNIAEQSAALFENRRIPPPPGPLPPGEAREEGELDTRSGYKFHRAFRCSTSKFGIGQVAGSNCTPLGLHCVAQKIGDGFPVGTIFKARQPVGQVPPGTRDATAITTRILWLEGLEPGFNRGGEVDTFARYIYIHGTGDETTIGRPASHGCVHLAAEDLIPLYDLLPVGTLVWIFAQ